MSSYVSLALTVVESLLCAPQRLWSYVSSLCVCPVVIMSLQPVSQLYVSLLVW